jgi:hypothetical protein
VSLPELLTGLAGLAVIATVGRVALSLFPLGAPGGHAPRHLATTWAASHLCGAIVLTAEERALALAGVDLAPLWLVLPWLPALAVRRLLSPSAMLPRQELRHERAGKTAAIVLVALTVASLVPWTRAASYGPSTIELGLEGCVALFAGALLEGGSAANAATYLYPASFAALIVLLAHGLERSRRAPLGRRVVLAVFVLTPVVQRLAAVQTPSILVALCVGAGAAFAIAWLRRADRRAAALTAFSFSGAALFDPDAALLGLVALASVCLVTAAPSRRSFATLAAPMWVVFALLGGAHVALAESIGDLSLYRARLGSLVRAGFRMETWELRWFALLPVLLIAVWHLRRPHETTRPTIDGPGRELAGLLAALTLGLLTQAVGSTLDRDAALLPVAAIGVLVVGLALVRTERPPGAAK